MLKKIIIIQLLFSIIAFAQSERDELFMEVEMILDKAKIDNADILCPNNYELAKEYYFSAQEMYLKKESPIKIREELEQSITYLTKMNNNIEEKGELFANTILIRNSALDSGADENAQYFWQLGETKLEECLELFDDGEFSKVPNNLKTVNDYYTTAKLYSNKFNTLVDNSESIVSANKRLAPLLAPKTFSEAEEKMFSTFE